MQSAVFSHSPTLPLPCSPTLPLPHSPTHRSREPRLRYTSMVQCTRRFVVLGGVGAIGRVAVRDLFESHRRNYILVADFDEERAQAYARSFRSRRVEAAFADARRTQDLAGLLCGHAVVVNCTQHHFNLHVMRAALAARIHYVDLGGLFHWTRRQLKLHWLFKDAGLTAVLGMGCAPGITNIMAQHAAGGFCKLQSIKIRIGSLDRNARPGAFSFPYSAQTVVEELALPPWIFSNGRFRRVQARTGWELVSFPTPVGKVWTVRTRHSEIATLPQSFRAKGLRYCDFRVSFNRWFVKELIRRLRSGWSVKQFAVLPAPRAKPNDHEVARVIVTGWLDSSSPSCVITMDCSVGAKPDWHASAGDIDTGRPLAAVAQMIASGIISQRGVLPPEIAVPAEAFFKEMKRRGLKFALHIEGGRRFEGRKSKVPRRPTVGAHGRAPMQGRGWQP